MAQSPSELQAQFAELENARREVAQSQQTYSINTAVEAWRKRRRPFAWNSNNHSCDCECIFDTVTTPPLPLIFGCTRTGSLHPCGEQCDHRVVTRESEFTCGLTGTYLGRVFVEAWADAHGAVPIHVGKVSEGNGAVGERRKFAPAISKSVKRKYTRPKRATIVEAVQRVLESDIDELAALEQTVTKDAADAIDAYIVECSVKKTWPMMHTARQRVHEVVAVSPLFGRSPLTPERVEAYVQSVERVWVLLERAIPNTQRTDKHVQTFTVAALYMLQHGIVLKSVRIASPDMWLYYNLPSVSTLAARGFQRRVVTAGRNMISEAMRRVSVLKSTE